MTNLISNALDAMKDGGELSVSVRHGLTKADGSREGVRVTIADSGVGMEPRVRSKLFEPFFTTKSDTGTGLGLWVSKGIIEKHQGKIRVRSVPGRGTAVSVFLPLDGLAAAAKA